MSGKPTLKLRAAYGASLLVMAAAAMPSLVSAQAAAPNDTGGKKADDSQVVVITGYRASLQSALSAKKKSGVMLDAINADDIASFPEANLAESLQRIPGISIDRDNGEGRTISVRGLGGDFTRVRINGMEALSTSGSNDSGTSPNRSRAFDFNSFASELFNNIQVRKSQDAQTDEGSLGATVDLNTGHPFDYKGTKFALSLEDAYYENGKHQNPRVAGLWSTRWDGGKMGFLISGAYQARDTSISNYARQAGSADYDYRGTSFAGNEYPQRAGFALPTGSTMNQTINLTTGAVTNTAVVTNPAVLAAETGSDPAAYAALYPTGYATPGRYDDSVVRIPALITLNDTELHSERVGITSSFQVQFDDNTRLTADYLFSRFRSESQNYQLQSVGLNRNNTIAGLNTLASGATAATKRGLYPGICTAVAETAIVGAQDCGQSLYGTTPVFANSVTGYTSGGVPILGPSVLSTSTVVPGGATPTNANTYSVNPYNLDPYDYYNNPASVGYIADSLGAGGRIALIGRPATKVLAAHVTNGTADYLQLSNVDWRSGNDASFYTTTFNQFSLNLDRKFSSTFKMNAQLGISNSTNVNEGFLIEFDAMDRPETMTYDERGRSDTMPVVNLGFNAADPKNWAIVKGFSAMRHFLRTTKSDFSTFKVDFDWNKSDHHDIKFGASTKKFTFSTDQYERLTDTLNPTEKEAGVTVASLGEVRPFGQGLELGAGTPTSFFAPSLSAFSKTFGYDCNCINKYGDWRLTNKRTNSATFGVTERDTGAYAQLDYNYQVFGHDVTGNLGVRQVETQIEGVGRTTAGRPVVETNDYSDTLPSLNVNFHAMDNLFVRFAASKAMARPLLANLSPAISAISVPNDGSTTGASLTVGNTKLKPFRSTNYDLSVEWYFAKNALLSFAVFDKEVASFPQTILFDGPLSNFLDADSIAATKAQFTTGTAAQNAAQVAYIDANNPFTARQVRDAPGGSLWGWEANYQQDLGFLPDHFSFVPKFVKNFGIQLNATHIDSKLQYILDPGVRVNGVQTKPQTTASGPWLNASPDALNFTFYYEVPQFSARVSVAKRAGYYTAFPIAAGSCNPGLQDPTAAGLANGAAGGSASQVACDSPLLNDFTGSRDTTNVDAVFNWNFNQHLSFRLEGLNLTNQTTNRYAYPLTAQPVVTLYGSTGRQITAGLRFKY